MSPGDKNRESDDELEGLGPILNPRSTVSRWDKVAAGQGKVFIFFRPRLKNGDFAARIECGEKSLWMEQHRPYSIGRDLRNDIVIRGDGLVSRKHAQVTFHDSRFHLKDLGSINGTFVNRNPIFKGKEIPLADGDEILVGQSAVLRFRLEPEPAGDAGK